jgi:hypothetical protein
VIEASWTPCGGVVAVVAVLRGDDMVGRLAGRPHAVVAALAAATHFFVIETCGRQKGRGRVALATTFGAQHVIGRFPDRTDK